MKKMMEILKPWPAARRTAPKAAVVLPLPSPVKICTKPLADFLANGAPLTNNIGGYFSLAIYLKVVNQHGHQTGQTMDFS